MQSSKSLNVSSFEERHLFSNPCFSRFSAEPGAYATNSPADKGE